MDNSETWTETYNRLKAEAMDKILKSAPKMLRARLMSGDF